MANDETALTLFREMGITEHLKSKILGMDKDFFERPEEDQRSIVEFWAEQAKATTEGVKARFPRAKILHAGSQAFELPGEAGDDSGKIVREFEAIILDQHITKAWWKDTFSDGGGGYPDCASLDGVRPYTPEPVSASCVARSL